MTPELWSGIKDMWRYPVAEEILVNFCATRGIRKGVCTTGHDPKENSGQAGETSGRVSWCRYQISVGKSNQ